MKTQGGCYCGAVRYEIDAEPLLNAQCHCRECQYISGGSPNVIIAVPDSGFHYVKGAPKTFRRKDLEAPVSREFCAECGTQLVTRAPSLAGVSIVKRGTLDNPAAYPDPQLAIFLVDKQTYHHVPAGIPAFERMPG